ncbi:MAG: protein kinase [Gemmatimonadetes bacterium]|nr:protein kinase [Gemmatimonadota bacterium]
MSAPADRLAAALADRYRIERELGAGGMATVYLAADLKHDRKVAIKVLKPELAAVLGAERFVVEIKTTAALSHPHILPLFDSGEAAGFLFYVMPYIEGETIREKLNRETQFGIEEALRITTEVADALDYAHRHGVIHRDIKPENILLHDGRPMVMDFGIALAVSAAAGGRMTETGLSLGTPHYMSPEQATADKQITARSDIYSLASVLYEMLAGEPPHSGGSAQAIIMKIIAEKAQPVTELRRSVPPNVAAALEKALEKVPADRFESASEFARALGDQHFVTALTPGASRAHGRRTVPTALFAAVALLLAALAAAGWLRSPSVPERAVARFTIDAGEMTRGIDVSPDGRNVLYVPSSTGMRLRKLDGDSAEFVPMRSPNARISPDGQWLLGVLPSGDLVIEPLRGGASRVLTQVNPNAAAIWGLDGFVYFALDGGLARIPADGGTVDTLAVSDTSRGRIVPMDALPDGRTLVVTLARAGVASISLMDVARRTTTPLFTAQRVQYVRYAPAGYLIYNDLNRILARTFDPRRRNAGEESITLAEGPPTRVLGFGIGGTTLAFTPIGGGPGTLVVADRSGGVRQLPNLPPGEYNVPRVSPDGRRFVVYRDDGGRGADLWVYEMPSGPLTQLTHTRDVVNRVLTWTPDGSRVVYTRSTRPRDVLWRRSDGTGEEEVLLERDGVTLARIAPDGRRVLYSSADGALRSASPNAPNGDQVVYRSGGSPYMYPSPDGRLVASQMLGTPPQIFVQSITGSGRRVQVSVRSGLDVKWSSNSRKLYFVDGTALMEATLDVGGDVRATLRRLPFYDRAGATYDVFPDDERFVMTRVTNESAVRFGEVTVIANFDVFLSPLARGAK